MFVVLADICQSYALLPGWVYKISQWDSVKNMKSHIPSMGLIFLYTWKSHILLWKEGIK